jgi:hypothetical protein
MGQREGEATTHGSRSIA